MSAKPDLQAANYIMSSGCAIESLRVLIEGAVYLYTEETNPIFHLAMVNKQYHAAQIFSTIGEALYLLQSHIRDMHMAYVEELQRQLEAEATS